MEETSSKLSSQKEYEVIHILKGRKQTIDFDVCKRNLLLKLQRELDKSKKGSVDEPVVELVDYINKTQDYCTTSSCSGRFAIFCAAYNEEKGAQMSVCCFYSQ